MPAHQWFLRWHGWVTSTGQEAGLSHCGVLPLRLPSPAVKAAWAAGAGEELRCCSGNDSLVGPQGCSWTAHIYFPRQPNAAVSRGQRVSSEKLHLQLFLVSPVPPKALQLHPALCPPIPHIPLTPQPVPPINALLLCPQHWAAIFPLVHQFLSAQEVIPGYARGKCVCWG